MLVNERQNEIYKYLQKHGSATVKTLAETFYVSEATLRRDLAEMQRLGLAERSHGGATLPEGAGEISMFVRVEKTRKKRKKPPSLQRTNSFVQTFCVQFPMTLGPR